MNDGMDCECEDVYSLTEIVSFMFVPHAARRAALTLTGSSSFAALTRSPAV